MRLAPDRLTQYPPTCGSASYDMAAPPGLATVVSRSILVGMVTVREADVAAIKAAFDGNNERSTALEVR